MLRLSVFHVLSLLVSFSLISACGGGGGGGGGTPDDPLNNPDLTRKKPLNNTQKDPPKPKIKQEAKELFKLAGQAATSQPPNYERALNYYQQAYEQDKNLKLAVYNMALVHEKRGDEQQARQYYEQAGNAGLGDGWVNLRLLALAKGDKGQAEALFNRALGVEPLNGQAHLNLALMDNARGDTQQAMKRVRDALKDDSSNADAYDVLARVYYDLKRFRLALLVTDAGLSELNPNHSGLWTTQGLIQLKLDDIIQAVRSFQKAVDLDEKNFAARLNLGLITFNYRDYEQSYQLLSQAVTLQPNHVEANLALAVIARTLKRYDEARKGYEKVLNLSPNHPGALFNLAVLDQDYTEVENTDFDKRRMIVKSALAQYNKLLGIVSNEQLRKKITLRIEEGKVLLEAIDVEQEEAKAMQEAAKQEQANPAPAPAP